LFGGDAIAGKNDNELDPAHHVARIRAFFVKPGCERRGIGRNILQASRDAATAMGFTRLDLVATLNGVALYSANGYTPDERYDMPLPNGCVLPVVKMTKAAR
jgi:GNAT superfamily N-acetyltransferase